MRAVTLILASFVLTACATGTPEAPVYESIVFVSERSGNGDIYALDPEGMSLTPLITTGAGEALPVWDRARSRLIYQIADDDGADLYSDQRRIMRDPSTVGTASWSPDGQTMVFVANRDGNENLFLARVDGNGERRLTDGRHTDRHPAFSPSGRQIVFAREDDIGWDLHSYDLDTATSTRHTLDGIYLAHPVWSPDGTHVAFARQYDAQTEIALLNISSGDTTRLTQRPEDDHTPGFSLDGERLVFASHNDTYSNLWEMRIDGSGLRQLTPATSMDTAPVYVPEAIWEHLFDTEFPSDEE